MSNITTQLLSAWNRSYNDRQKLQHVYLTVAAGLLLTAGLIGLISYDTGQKLLIIAIVSLFIFIANSVVWALLHTFILTPVNTAKSSRSKAAKNTTARTRTSK